MGYGQPKELYIGRTVPNPTTTWIHERPLILPVVLQNVWQDDQWDPIGTSNDYMMLLVQCQWFIVIILAIPIIAASAKRRMGVMDVSSPVFGCIYFIYSSFLTVTIKGPTLSPVFSLCLACDPSHSGKVPDCQQRQYTFLEGAVNVSIVATLADSKSMDSLMRVFKKRCVKA